MRLNRVLRVTGAFLAAGVLQAAPAFAQTTSVIIGTVTDAATNQPVPDVAVTATSPSLQGEQVVVTDSGGNYRIPQLPPGVYTLRYDKEGYRPFSRPDVTLRLDRTVRVNTQIVPEALTGETVEIVGRAPTIDVGSATTGINVGEDFVRNIAVARPTGRGGAQRSFESLAEIAPGAQEDRFGVSINGATSPENGYIIDGVSVNNPRIGLNGSPLTLEFIEDINIVTGGYLPEYGRSTGGVLNAVTKSGSNEFHGSLFGTWTPGFLARDPSEVPTAGTTLRGTESLYNVGDVGLTLGGPIIRDRLWFFAGVAPSFTRYEYEQTANVLRLCTQADRDADAGRCNRATTGNPNALRFQDPETGFDVADPVTGARVDRRYIDQRSLQFLGKLTYLFSANHNVSVSVAGTPTRSGDEDSWGFDPEEQVSWTPAGLTSNGAFSALNFASRDNPLDVALKTSSSFLEKRVLLDVTLGWHHQATSILPIDRSPVGSTDPSDLSATPAVQFRRAAPRRSLLEFERADDQAFVTACSVPVPGATPDAAAVPGENLRCPIGTTYNVGGPGFIRDDTLNRYQGKAVGTLLAQAAGHHVIKAGVDVELMTFRGEKAYTSGVFLREAVDFYGVPSFDYVRSFGFLQGPDTAVFVPSLPTDQNSTSIGGFVQDSWSVMDLFTINAGLRYDMQRLTGNDDRTALNFPYQFSPRIGVIYDFTQQGRSKLYANFARYYEQVPLNIVERAFPGEAALYGVVSADPTAEGGAGCNPLGGNARFDLANCLDRRNVLAGDVTGESSSETPSPRYSRVGAPGTTAVDPDLKPQSSDEFVVGGEYEVISNLRSGVSYTRRSMVNVVEDMSRDEGHTYFIGNPGRGIAQDFPEARRDYDAVSFYVDKVYADFWLFNASYTWSKLRGNYAGLFRPENGQIDPNSNSTYDLQSLLVNQDGDLPGDRRHQVKVFAAREFPLTPAFGFNVGLSYRGQSGTPINYLGAHPIYGRNESYILPRGAAGRTPWRNDIDGRVGVTYRLTRNTALAVGLDVFNIFNFQKAVRVDNEFTTAAVLPVAGGTTADLTDLNNTDPNGNVLSAVSGNPITGANVNPNHGNVTLFQPPRTMRLTASLSF